MNLQPKENDDELKDENLNHTPLLTNWILNPSLREDFKSITQTKDS